MPRERRGRPSPWDCCCHQRHSIYLQKETSAPGSQLSVAVSPEGASLLDMPPTGGHHPAGAWGEGWRHGWPEDSLATKGWALRFRLDSSGRGQAGWRPARASCPALSAHWEACQDPAEPDDMKQGAEGGVWWATGPLASNGYRVRPGRHALQRLESGPGR